jgi:hypothetical protein
MSKECKLIQKSRLRFVVKLMDSENDLIIFSKYDLTFTGKKESKRIILRVVEA